MFSFYLSTSFIKDKNDIPDTYTRHVKVRLKTDATQLTFHKAIQNSIKYFKTMI